MAGVRGQERLAAARTKYGRILTFKQRLLFTERFGAEKKNAKTL